MLSRRRAHDDHARIGRDRQYGVARRAQWRRTRRIRLRRREGGDHRHVKGHGERTRAARHSRQLVSPGLIGGTEFHSRFTPPDAFAAAEKAVPLGRAGTPEEVAKVIAFLVSDDASYLVGETIEINGGLLMR